MNPWDDRINCVFDKHFRCFKADKVRIMIGHQFKFVANSGKSYMVSNRYANIKDSQGNINNFYDPRKQRVEKRYVQTKYIPHARVDIAYQSTKETE